MMFYCFACHMKTEVWLTEMQSFFRSPLKIPLSPSCHSELYFLNAGIINQSQQKLPYCNTLSAYYNCWLPATLNHSQVYCCASSFRPPAAQSQCLMPAAGLLYRLCTCTVNSTLHSTFCTVLNDCNSSRPAEFFQIHWGTQHSGRFSVRFLMSSSE